MGISLALKAGIAVALISGEDSPLIDRYAAKMRITDVWKGSKQKARALEEFAERRGFDLSAICFMGDDVNCRHERGSLQRPPGRARIGFLHLHLPRGKRCGARVD
jgi:hypothetical protein